MAVKLRADKSLSTVTYQQDVGLCTTCLGLRKRFKDLKLVIYIPSLSINRLPPPTGLDQATGHRLPSVGVLPWAVFATKGTYLTTA